MMARNARPSTRRQRSLNNTSKREKEGEHDTAAALFQEPSQRQRYDGGLSTEMSKTRSQKERERERYFIGAVVMSES